MAEQALRCGYVAVVGRPNVGKSTLVNQLVGEKITIVTGKPQTTRHNILGVMNGPELQVIYVDTPGIHEHRGREINRAMNRSAVFAIEDADVVLFVCEATRWDAGDDYVLGQLAKARGPVIVALNKIDKLRRRELLLPRIDELQGRANFAAIVPVSALRGQQLDSLVGEIRDLLPMGPRLFPIDAKTDRDMSFRASELIREQLLEQIHREVPYGILVEVDIDDHDPAGTDVQATIWVERESHKAIVIGAGGRRLKSVGTKARLQLRDMLGKPVHVETHVRVKRNWSHSARVLRQHGIDSAGGSSGGG